jgi:Flp pilus assembly protein TadD
MNEPWWVFLQERVQGPFTTAQLKELLASHQLDGTSLVRGADGADWKPAAEVPGLIAPKAPRPPAASRTTPSPPVAARTAPSAPPPLPAAAAQKSQGLFYAAIGGGATALTIGIAVLVFLLVRDDDKPQAEAKVADSAAATDAGDGDDSSRPGGARPVQESSVEVSSGEPVRSQGTAESTATEPAAQSPGGESVATGDEIVDDPLADAMTDTELEEALTFDPEVSERSELFESDSADVAASAPENAAAVGALLQSSPELHPEPLLPLLLPEKTPISDARITEFGRRVALEETADNAYALYLRFSQSHVFSGDQEQRVNDQLAVWRGRADQGLARLGGKWVPPAEAIAARDAARSLVDRAEVLVQAGDFTAAVESLNEASNTNPNSVRAEYILGLLYSLPQLGRFGADQAQGHFEDVLRRAPDDPAALNSLAVSLVKQHEHSQAFRYFERAATLSEYCPEVVQNLGRFCMLVATNRINSSSRETYRKYEKLYTELTAAGKGPAFDDGTGWLHVVPIFENEQASPLPTARADAGSAESLDRRRLIASGAGCVVAPEYILTNRHVIESSRRWGGTADYGIADEVRVTLQGVGQNGRELLGAVVAISNETDLALVQVPGLDLPAIVWGESPPAADAEVMLLGFSREAGLHAGLSTHSFTVTTTEETATDVLVLQTEQECDQTGGLVLETTGRAAGLLAMQFNSDSSQFGAIPAAQVTSFLAEHIPNWTSWNATRPLDDPPGGWSTIVERAAEASVRVKCFYDAGESAISSARTDLQVARNTYEDFTCPGCGGLSWIPCPQNGCAQGQVTERFYQTVTTQAGPIRSTARVPQTRKVTCPTCRGADRLDCVACVNGNDAALLGQNPELWQQPVGDPSQTPIPGVPPEQGQPGLPPGLESLPEGNPIFPGRGLIPGVEPTEESMVPEENPPNTRPVPPGRRRPGGT